MIARIKHLAQWMNKISGCKISEIKQAKSW